MQVSFSSHYDGIDAEMSLP